MKKILALALILAMVFGLCACTKSETKPTAQAGAFQAGYGRANITPSYSVPLAGYGNTSTRMSQGFLDYLYATCVALRDDKGNTALIYTTDLIATRTGVYEEQLEAISEATGVPATNIVISGTHTHSGPDLANGDASIKRYKEDLKANLVQAGKDAIADLAPAKVLTGSTEIEGLNFVRHYIMNDGTYSGDNFGSSASGYKAHERDADKQMQIVRLIRDDQSKKDILMLNWQAHPKVASTNSTPEGKFSRSMMSADYVGFMRQNVEQETGCLVAYYLGAAGNLNPLSNIQEEQKNVPQDVKVFGKQLSDGVVAALDGLKEVQPGAVVTKRTMFPAQIDHTEDHLLPQAQVIADLWRKTNDYSLCASEGKPYGVMSPYHATSIVSRANNSATVREMELNAITIGPVGFVTAPYEMFCQNGQAIKEGSPCQTTFVLTCCNGSNNYIAADAAFEYGSYEVHNRTFARGTAEDLQNEMIAMLKEINGQ